jgi:lipoprotein-anchoring transpeptidase ErfK/SrfK
LTGPSHPRWYFLYAVTFIACSHRAPPTGIDATVAPERVVIEDVFVDVDARPRDTGPSFVRPTRVMATAIWTPVHVEPRRLSHNMGYLRAGAVVDVVDGPHGREGCVVHRGHPEGGWYRIQDGGYVCVGGALASRYPNRDFLAPAQPTLDAAMPYRYAINYGTSVLYRRPPTRDDIRMYESARPQPAAGGGGDDDDDEAPRPARPRRLDELKGERRSPMIRRLLSGMYVALDRSVRDVELDDRYWHTMSGGYVRAGRLSFVDGYSTFHGNELTGEVTLPYAFVAVNEGYNYVTTPDGGVVAQRRLPRFTGVQLVDRGPTFINRGAYWRTVDGRTIHSSGLRRATLQTPPAGTGPGERWIDVDLDEQILVAYDGPRPAYVTLISSGRPSDDPTRNYETPSGTFRIQSKHITSTMDGETQNGVYSIEDVPWVMYFEGSYALHGTFWHHHFGWRMSHGCVNMAPLDARWLLLWSEPRLPMGWHGVYSNAQQPGSQVVIRHSRNNQRTEEGRPAEATQAGNSGN